MKLFEMASEFKPKKKRTAREKTADIALAALGAVIIVLCSWVSVPSVVPFTLQTFGVFFVLCTLGGKRGFASVCLYIALGALGAPVFANFNAGISALFGMTGGYILGFVFTGISYCVFTRFFGKKQVVKIASLVVGLVLCYLFGTLWFTAVYTKTQSTIGFTAAFASCVLPFIIPDLVKLALAVALAKRISPLLDKQK